MESLEEKIDHLSKTTDRIYEALMDNKWTKEKGIISKVHDHEEKIRDHESRITVLQANEAKQKKGVWALVGIGGGSGAVGAAAGATAAKTGLLAKILTFFGY